MIGEHLKPQKVLFRVQNKLKKMGAKYSASVLLKVKVFTATLELNATPKIHIVKDKTDFHKLSPGHHKKHMHVHTHTYTKCNLK